MSRKVSCKRREESYPCSFVALRKLIRVNCCHGWSHVNMHPRIRNELDKKHCGGDGATIGFCLAYIGNIAERSLDVFFIFIPKRHWPKVITRRFSKGAKKFL